MKKYIFLLLPLVGLNAQVTIGPESQINNTSAMLNITMPNSVFILPVGDINTLNRNQSEVPVVEGSMIYHKKSNNSNVSDQSGIYFRVMETSAASLTPSLKWKPFHSTKKTYVYNNILSNIDENLLGYSSISYSDLSDRIPTNCFVWNNEDGSQPMSNNHVYCLIDNAKHGVITDPRLDNTEVCSNIRTENTNVTSTETKSNRSTSGLQAVTTYVRGNVGAITTSGGTGNSKTRTQTRKVTYTRNYIYRLTVTDVLSTVTDYKTYTDVSNSWSCAFGTAMMDKGYLATITSQEENNFIQQKLRSLAISTDNIAIGLRNILNNEGDKSSTATTADLYKASWVNGEVNNVGWLERIKNSTLPVNQSGSITGVNNAAITNVAVKTYKKTEKFNVVKEIEYIVTYTGTIDEKITSTRLNSNSPWTDYPDWTEANPSSISNWSGQTSSEIVLREISKNLVINSNPNINPNPKTELINSTTNIVTTNYDCGLLRVGSTSLNMGNCQVGNYNKVLVEYNN